MTLGLPLPAGRIARLWARFFGGQTFSPREFWEARHASLSGKLSAVGHAQLSEAQNREQYEIKVANIRKTLLRHVPEPSGKTLLDAGCGVGVLTRLYVELGLTVAGVDFSHSAIESARSMGLQAEFHQSALEELALGRLFDVVCMIDVLQHIVDDECYCRALAALARHVRRNGLAVVVETLDDGFGSATHCRRRSLQQHEAEFRVVGLEIIDRDQFTLPHERSVKDILVLRRRF